MPRQKPFIQPRWVRYEVSRLVQDHIDVWKAFCRQRDYLQQGPLRDSPSDMHRKNMERPRLETVSKLLDLALKQTGPVRFQGRLFKSDFSTYEKPESADDSVQAAEGLFVEIHSPINGLARKCQ